MDHKGSDTTEWLTLKIINFWDFPGGLVFKTLSSNIGGADLIPGQRTKNSCALWSKKLEHKQQKQYFSKLNKDFQNHPHQKKKKLKTFVPQRHHLENEKISQRLGENIYKSHICKELVSRKSKELLQFNDKKIIQFLQWAKDLNRHFIKEDVWMEIRTWKCAQYHCSQG